MFFEIIGLPLYRSLWVDSVRPSTCIRIRSTVIFPCLLLPSK